LRPSDLHEFKVKSGGVMYSINFLPEVLSDDVFRSFLSSGRFLSATFSEKDSALTELLLEKLLLLQNAGNDEKTSSAILTLIVTMLLGVDSAKELVINDVDIYKAIRYLNDNFTSSPSLTEACAVAGLTKTYFCRKFKSVTGKSYVAFLSELKIDFACNLIKGGKINFTEVCYASGFNSVSQFIREFKKIKGITPTEYKKTVKSK
jgi:AraC-like DNA-binding protein